jgi:hypothetical protein
MGIRLEDAALLVNKCAVRMCFYVGHMQLKSGGLRVTTIYGAFW